ncbi:MAG: hypothetical protein KME69_13335 [Candidatus Thiodiazotropha sp. (ex Codakia orbicularis)]|nr:hypothetical protein [Candidatus Thiodiazotropha sp. (ex Codakia orbicularis)]
MTEVDIMAVFPKGIILAWYADSGDFPHGWAVCDGHNDTPDLRGKFIMGVSDMADVGRLRGSETHNHSVSGRTSYQTEGTQGGPEGADNFSGTNWSHKHDFVAQSSTSSNIPPSVTVLYIMKT